MDVIFTRTVFVLGAAFAAINAYRDWKNGDRVLCGLSVIAAACFIYVAATVEQAA